MFLNVSKNIGGFRIGLGTSLNSYSKRTTNKQLKTAEFVAFMQKVQNELNTALVTFIEANGQKFKNLQKNKADLDDVFSSNPKYPEFTGIFNKAKLEIEKVFFSGDDGIIAKRKITEATFKVKEFINLNYPNFQNTYKFVTEKKVGFLLFLGIFLFPFLFSWLTLRKGYSKKARFLSFIWLGFFVWAMINAENIEKQNMTDKPQQVQIEEKKFN